MRKIIFNTSLLIFIVSLFAFSSCLGDSQQTISVSDDASVLSMTIQRNDSSPNAALATFIVNEEEMMIYNLDSLPYGTRVDSLHLNIQFASSTGYIINDSVSENVSYSAYGTGNTGSTANAIDFTKKVKLKNIATDKKASKEYIIDLRVHQVETYLHTWTQLKNQVLPNGSLNQKALLLDKKFYYFHGYASENKLYTSTDATNWTLAGETNGLPVGVSLRDIQVYNSKLIVLHNGNEIYQSVDGLNWTKSDIDGDNAYDYKSLLFSFKDKLWAVAQHKISNNVRIANSIDGVSWQFSEQREFTDFPIGGFSSTSFKPVIGREKVLVVGGMDVNGNYLNTLWSAENRLGVDTLYWVNLKHRTFEFPEISEASTAYYGSKMLIFGGLKSPTEVADTLYQLTQSIDEGLTWVETDTLQNRLPENYAFRSNASLIHDKENYTLYIIGGKNKSMQPLTDVWKVKVNFYDFDDFFEDPTKY